MLSSTPRIPDIPSPPAPARRPGAKPIEPRKFHDVRVKLRRYRVAVQLEGVAVPPSLNSSSPFAGRGSGGTTSTASRTQPCARSESSFATSRTNLTAVWSARNGSVQFEPEARPLSPVLKARKALVRYLKKCDGDCQGRKVKCFLSHHSLEDILDGNHDAEAESDVYWALRFDSDPKGGDVPSRIPANQSIYEDGEGELALQEESSPPMKEVIDYATYNFDVPATPDLLYPITIDDAHLELSLPDPDEPSLHLLTPVFAPAPPSEFRFDTRKTPSTLRLATEVVTLTRSGPYRYFQCLLPMGSMGTCAASCPSPQHLLAHVQRAHAGFVPLRPDPLRLVCPNCFAFYAAPVGACASCCAVPARLVVNICGEFCLESEGGGLEMGGAFGGAAAYDAFDWEGY